MKTNLDQIKAGADIHAGDGGYSLGTQEAYDEFVKNRNRSLAKARLREARQDCMNDTDINHCSVCQCEFSNAEGGIHGYFGMIPVSFCPTCFSCMCDMVDQVVNFEERLNE